MSSNNSTNDAAKHATNGLKIAASTIAAPVATSAAINAAGFTAAGIVKGSWGALLMSKAAILSGGTISKGSTVAILQSIGATGILSPYLIPVAIIAGTVAVAAVYGPDVVKHIKEKLNEHNDNETTPNLS